MPHFCVHLYNKKATSNTQHCPDYRATALSSQWEQFDQPPSSVSPYPSSLSTKMPERQPTNIPCPIDWPSMWWAATVLWPDLHHPCLLTALHQFYKAYHSWASPTIQPPEVPKSPGARTCTFFKHFCIAVLLYWTLPNLDLCWSQARGDLLALPLQSPAWVRRLSCQLCVVLSHKVLS